MISLTNYNVNHMPPKKLFGWVGLQNYIDMFTMDSWMNALLHTPVLDSDLDGVCHVTHHCAGHSGCSYSQSEGDPLQALLAHHHHPAVGSTRFYLNFNVCRFFSMIPLVL